MKFHISLVNPAYPRDWSQLWGTHWPNAYREIIESVRWGLSAIGHDVSVGENSVIHDGATVIFGFQVLNEAMIESCPPNTIVYNLEQLSPSLLESNVAFRAAARRMRIWEYSERNLELWSLLKPAHAPVHVPIGWAPTLARIPRAENQDIDVLIYGVPSDSRLHTYKRVCAKGMRSVFIFGLHGAARDTLISRTRLVLNINSRGGSNILEVVRISYLLANGKAVVADLVPELYVEPDLRDAVHFAGFDDIAEACAALLDVEAERLRLEKRGEEIFRKRDIRPILSRALEQ